MSAKSGGRTESFIDREIREQLRREMELAEDRKYLSNNADKPESPNTVQPASESGGHRLQRQDDDSGSDDSCDCQVDDDGDRLLDEYKHSHSGESLIARELTEQQKREEELRQYWREMGFEFNNNNKNNSDDASDNDDKFQYRQNDDDKERNEEHQELRGRSVPVGLTSDSHSTNNFAEYTKQAYEEHTHSHASHKHLSEADKSSAGVPGPAVADVPTHDPEQSLKSFVHAMEETPKPTNKTLPLHDYNNDNVDGDYTRTLLFVPQWSRSLEREIRAAREREEELRHARGLTTASHDDVRPPVAVQIEAIKSRRSVTDVVDVRDTANRREPDYQTLTKRHAEDRLRDELQRDLQRELDLRRSGLIHSISEQHAGQQSEVVEVLSSQGPAAMKQWSTAATARPVELDFRRELTGSSNHADVQADKAAATEVTKPSAMRVEMPRVLRKYAYPYSDWRNSVTADTHVTSTRVSPQARVEQEVAELRRRESELRFIKLNYINH